MHCSTRPRGAEMAWQKEGAANPLRLTWVEWMEVGLRRRLSGLSSRWSKNSQLGVDGADQWTRANALREDPKAYDA